MNDHLPECVHSEPHLNPGFLVMCICNRLRACEQRTWDEAYACGFNAGRDHGEKVGRAAGLRDAVNSDAVRGAIRIAEERVREECLSRPDIELTKTSGYLTGYAMGQADMRKYLLADDTHSYTYGHRAALDAAQEAVAALFPVRRYQSEHEAILAAIDALREEQK